jgi:hypothetical protein
MHNERKSEEDIIVTARSMAYGPLRMVEWKGPKHAGVSCVYEHVFNILVFLNVKVSVFYSETKCMSWII